MVKTMSAIIYRAIGKKGERRQEKGEGLNLS